MPYVVILLIVTGLVMLFTGESAMIASRIARGIIICIMIVGVFMWMMGITGQEEQDG